jgi:hypothetical protein
MYVYILIQEEANVKPSTQSICGASDINIDIAKDEPDTK